jgi:hypothetical protein
MFEILRKITTIAITCAVAFNSAFSMDMSSGKLQKPRVLYGAIQDDMVSVKACGEALYLNKTTRTGLLKPIPNNVHDMLFFPVAVDEIDASSVAIVTYNPWYPSWAQSGPVYYEVPYKELKCGWDAQEYESHKKDVKCMIVGNGLFSKQYGDYELWYKPKADK